MGLLAQLKSIEELGCRLSGRKQRGFSMVFQMLHTSYIGCQTEDKKIFMKLTGMERWSKKDSIKKGSSQASMDFNFLFFIFSFIFNVIARAARCVRVLRDAPGGYSGFKTTHRLAPTHPQIWANFQLSKSGSNWQTANSLTHTSRSIEVFDFGRSFPFFSECKFLIVLIIRLEAGAFHQSQAFILSVFIEYSLPRHFYSMSLVWLHIACLQYFFFYHFFPILSSAQLQTVINSFPLTGHIDAFVLPQTGETGKPT